MNTYTAFFIRLCKYCISRNILSFTTTTVPSLAEGYTKIYAALLTNHETENKNELITFYQKLVELKSKLTEIKTLGTNLKKEIDFIKKGGSCTLLFDISGRLKITL